MSLLRRELAPLGSAAWDEIDAQARRVLKVALAARKLVDFVGPLGPAAAAVNLGRLEALRGGPVQGVRAARRTAQPLVELRVPFELRRAEIDAIERGCKDPDLKALDEAAQRIARAEDTAVFHGYEAGGIRGIAAASAHTSLRISNRYEEYPRLVAEATRLLREGGVDGPYAIALGPRCYAGLMQATEHGYPVLELVRRVIDGPLVWAPAVDGAVVLSTRGGDFELSVGEDLSIGYDSHDDGVVRLHLVETFAFRVLSGEAAVALRYAEAKRR
jgi:uncharacterized linocin/CFP29 family protein